ncbi:LysR family transcriptional regulator [Azotobacter salinestris]
MLAIGKDDSAGNRQRNAFMKAPRVTLDQWRTLQAVVDHGGFAQAAEVLHRSQSSVSYTVARMQEQLGVPLLRIEGRKAVLTEAGTVLLRRSRQLVKQASQLEDLAHHMEQGWEAEVRLVVDAAYPTLRLVRALTAFMPQSRGCRVRLREEVLSGVEEVLLEGGADLAISSLSIPGYLGSALSEVEFVAVAHPDHPLHRLQRTLSATDLESQMQVVIRDTGRQQPRDIGWLGAEQRWTVGSLATAATFVGSGLGFAWLPCHLIRRELAEGLLKPLPLAEGATHRPRFLLYADKDKPLGPATQILVELIKTFDSAPLNAPFAAPLASG